MERAFLVGAQVMRATTVYREAGRPVADPMVGPVGLMAIRQYLETARRQQERMAESEALRAAARDRLDAGDAAALEDLWAAAERSYAELHFYAVAWDLIGRVLVRLKECSGLKAFGTVHHDHRGAFRDYAALRHHLEHLENRLPGMAFAADHLRAGAPLAPPDTKAFGWDDDGPGLVTIGDRSWDVSPASLTRLESIVAGLLRDLEREATAIIGAAELAPAPSPPEN